MPAKSQAQQNAAGAALFAWRSDRKVNDLKGSSRTTAQARSAQELHGVASVRRFAKPQHAGRD